MFSKYIVQVTVCVGCLLTSINSLALNNPHDHKVPNDFRVSCKVDGWDKLNRSDFIWRKEGKQLIVTGKNVDGDRGYLKESDNGSVSIASSFWKGEKIPGQNFERPDIKTVYMTFRYNFKESAYHGEGWSEFRGFVFQIRGNGESGSVWVTDSALTEGILETSYHRLIQQCIFSGIHPHS